ncbi:putative caffeoyl-CoA O-methyltransferase [Helianthus annuus]|uniref:Caffeoyl-CoA O-methyltransferase n=1 Tax=Helianthus annuus TaxID=4232 RepID=A0A9K3I7S7_HELAN|nr:putative caffeoyl-CoA O-methyltransferase [Helianthus annuus]KAJ0513099.1 putative caffeoyl-CoA O-methyltransferase [Helianthus annuus]KAJ0526758.1 putative caffeoyl-CoA O-methyltransferase [Helianthus annuus]KAJ0706824.1 putative caffeoyl-CoA O-methyltransferase [Helianthus annuus]KAJ0708204.1 putative caffeoyl-CoA O-methyltransferase [Helianthus annuus]
MLWITLYLSECRSLRELANLVCLKILRELREETAPMRGSQMQVSPDQTQSLAMLVQILRQC